MGFWAKGALVAVLGMGVPALSWAAGSTEQLADVMSEGVFNLDLRLRYEDVKQDNALADADALTLRTRLGFTTGKWNDLDAMVEIEDVHALGSEDFNSCPAAVSDSCNGNTAFSVIPDPSDTELNQYWLRYGGFANTVLKYGRQRLILDNARFIGNVGWRQNEMTYDGFSLVNTTLPEVAVNYSHLTNANNIFFGDFQLDAELVNIVWEPSEKLRLVGYGYLVDFDVDVAARHDSKTYGLRATGVVPLEAAKLLYVVEYAKQDRYKDSPSIVDADYGLVELGMAFKPVTFKLGYEVLGGDGSFGFQTPLATLHAFQGWADLFLGTPAAGVQDSYISAASTVAGFGFLAVYHDFSADDGGAEYGDELDLQVSYPIKKNLSLQVRYADYNADSFAVDTQKLWVQAEYKY